MTRREKISILALLIALISLLWRFAPSSRPTVSTDHISEQRPSPSEGRLEDSREVREKEIVNTIRGVLATPIAFYGKVVDQNGSPVSNADIDYGTIDKFFEEGSEYGGKSDANGNFFIDGINGAVLTVGVSKNFYYNIHGKSNKSFAYGVGADSTRGAPPSKEKPAVFMLQKMGQTEPLIQVLGKQINIPKTGQPLGIDLATGQAGRGNLQIESELGDTTKKPFNWRFRLSVPGGGLVERRGQFDFEAPTEGYQLVSEVGIAADSKQWTSRMTKEYFARLEDGRYARFSIRFYPGARNFVVLESYVNPTSGSRNLEFDPAKIVNLR